MKTGTRVRLTNLDEGSFNAVYDEDYAILAWYQYLVGEEGEATGEATDDGKVRVEFDCGETAWVFVHELTVLDSADEEA